MRELHAVPRDVPPSHLGQGHLFPPPGEIRDFLYSPSFALLFAPFAIWPFALDLLLWNGVNALAVY